MLASIKIVLDTRRLIQKTATYPIKLRVTFLRKTKDYPTKFHLSKTDYEKLSAPRINQSLQTIRDQLRSIERSAEDFIRDQETFSFVKFEYHFIAENALLKKRKEAISHFIEEPQAFDYSVFAHRFPLFEETASNPKSISIVYLSYIKMLLQEDRIGTALSYQKSYNSLKSFRGNISFPEITVSFLHQFEKWKLKKGNSKATIGIDLRPLRTMFNYAIELGIIKRENCYPFGRRRYQIPTGRNLKKALTIDQIKAVYYYTPQNDQERKAKDFWLFCFLANGMNPQDLIRLKNKNIEGEYINFIRTKTERSTKQDPKPITVFITEDLREIIERWRNKDKDPKAYLLPFMDDSLDALQQYDLARLFTKSINDHMKVIGRRLELDQKLTTIVSRHSFSTQLKRSGVSTEYIQEALGHTDKRTTENYLDSFDKEVKKEFANLLLSFKNT